MPRDARLYMTFPIDFDEHPKIEGLSDSAFRAFVAMNGYSRRQGLDGVIPAATARRRWKPKALAELVASHPERPVVLLDGENYVIRDYAEHQLTTADIEETRLKRAAAGARGGKQSANAKANAKQVLEQTPSKTQAELEIEITPSKEGVVADRPDVTRICTMLADLIESNGSKRPTITKAWLDSARLMIDVDKRPLAETIAVMQWSQADQFWRSNVLSMGKFREKYDQLRLQRQGAKPDSGDSWGGIPRVGG
jgi:hypothetical protein